ncbi:MAG: adenylyl-sulfate kinase [Lentisphaeria bacterium]
MIKEREKATPPKERNLTWHQAAVTTANREKLLRQRGAVLWMTGLSGAGKSTIASALDKKLYDRGHLSYILDGDNIRHGLNSDLAFSPVERTENIRRVGEVATLFAEAGLLAITSFISPYRKDRQNVRNIIGTERFIEIFLDVPLAVCEKRDPKSLYKKARAGEIQDFTGIQAPYEAPVNPELTIDTSSQGVDECAQLILDYLVENNTLLDA